MRCCVFKIGGRGSDYVTVSKGLKAVIRWFRSGMLGLCPIPCFHREFCVRCRTLAAFPLFDGFDDRLLADPAAILPCEPDDVETKIDQKAETMSPIFTLTVGNR